jgi:hypothetical protein
MANGEQIERCIQEAKEQIAAKGFDNCEANTILLVSIDHMTNRFTASLDSLRQEIQKNTVTLNIGGKKAAAIWTAIGGVLAGIGTKVFGT